jgi:hypothetical protein
MNITGRLRFATLLAAALAVSATSAAFADASETSSVSQYRPMAGQDPQPFASFDSGATEKWCGSLPYPYCENPTPDVPGTGPVPFVDPMPQRPIFGN